MIRGERRNTTVYESCSGTTYENRDGSFGNSRGARNRFEDVISRQANRPAETDAPTKEDLLTVIKAGLLTAEETARYEEEMNREKEE